MSSHVIIVKSHSSRCIGHCRNTLKKAPNWAYVNKKASPHRGMSNGSDLARPRKKRKKGVSSKQREQCKGLRMETVIEMERQRQKIGAPEGFIYGWTLAMDRRNKWDPREAAKGQILEVLKARSGFWTLY